MTRASSFFLLPRSRHTKIQDRNNASHPPMRLKSTVEMCVVCESQEPRYVPPVGSMYRFGSIIVLFCPRTCDQATCPLTSRFALTHLIPLPLLPTFGSSSSDCKDDDDPPYPPGAHPSGGWPCRGVEIPGVRRVGCLEVEESEGIASKTWTRPLNREQL